ncbi:hypothetical protein TNCV_2518231 [Trichonephila clavipes]|nr:hypothetical protein TNCV_2518231 [Trichonephila clavipes]
MYLIREVNTRQSNFCNTGWAAVAWWSLSQARRWCVMNSSDSENPSCRGASVPSSSLDPGSELRGPVT